MLDDKKVVNSTVIEKRRVLIVLGMHRSGTSAMAGVLNQLSIPMGDTLMPPRKGENEKGFWEDEGIVGLHELLLKELGMSWDDTRLMPNQWWMREGIYEIKLQLSNLISSNYGTKTLWAFKDPRVCRLMPLWYQILSELEIEPLFIHIIRNPMDVARSLAARDGFTQDKSFLLWLLHNMDAFQSTVNHLRVVLDYDELLETPGHVIEQVCQKLHLSDCINGASRKAIDEFVTFSLRHHNTGVEKLNTLPPIIARFYEVCRCQMGGITEDFDEKIGLLATEFIETASFFHPWQQISNELDTKLIKVRQHIVECERTIAKSDAELEMAREYLAERDSTIAHLEPLLENTQNELETARQHLVEREETIAKSNIELEKAREYLAERDSTIAHLEPLLDITQTELKTARRHLVEREVVIAKSDAELEKAREYLAERDSTIAHLEPLLEITQTELKTARRHLVEREAVIAKSDAELEKAREYLAERDSTIARLEPLFEDTQSELEIARQHLVKREAVIAKSDAELEKARKYLVERDRTIAHLEPLLEDTQSELETARQHLVEREETIAKFDTELEKAREYLAERDTTIAHLEPVLKETQSELGMARQYLTEREATIAKSNIELEKAREYLMEHDATIARYESAYQKSQRHIREKNKILSQINEELENVCREHSLLNEKINRITTHWSWSIVEKLITKGK